MTETSKTCRALSPSGSDAVTVNVALPCPTAETVTTAPDTEAAATASFDEETANVSASPSGSANAPETSTVAVSFTAASTAESVPSGVGARLVGGRGGVGPAASPPHAPDIIAANPSSVAQAVALRAADGGKRGG